MAATASFKQQCPSCEAWVPVRDANLIGRKIDCPKCKYRFVVEDPGDAADAEEDGPRKAKKSKRDEEGNGKALKGKAGRRRDEDDDGDDDQAVGAKGGNSKLALIIGVSAVAIVALLVVGYFMLFDNSSPSGNRSSGTSGSSGGSNNPAPAPEPAKETKVADDSPASSSPTGEFITNLLPPTT